MHFRMFDGPDMNKLTEIARKSPPGLPRDQLIPGCYVMISPNKGTGDRSYTDDIWSIVALAGTCRNPLQDVYSYAKMQAPRNF